MKSIFFVFLLSLAFVGCANVNPRNNSPIRNDNGNIEEIKNNQNGVIAEIGKLRQENAMTNSRIEELQQGLVNLNAAVSKNENSGVQILQGDGALIMVFSLCIIGMMMFYYRDKAIKNEKAANVMAKEIAKVNDPVLNDNVLVSALSQKCEKQVYKMLTNKFKDNHNLV